MNGRLARRPRRATSRSKLSHLSVPGQRVRMVPANLHLKLHWPGKPFNDALRLQNVALEPVPFPFPDDETVPRPQFAPAGGSSTRLGYRNRPLNIHRRGCDAPLRSIGGPIGPANERQDSSRPPPVCLSVCLAQLDVARAPPGPLRQIKRLAPRGCFRILVSSGCPGELSGGWSRACGRCKLAAKIATSRPNKNGCAPLPRRDPLAPSCGPPEWRPQRGNIQAACEEAVSKFESPNLGQAQLAEPKFGAPRRRHFNAIDWHVGAGKWLQSGYKGAASFAGASTWDV